MYLLTELKSRKKVLIGFLIFDALLLLVPLLLMLVSYLMINPYQKHVRKLEDVAPTTVGIVLGAGINDEGKPYKELEARLDVGAQALQSGKVQKLILSGDNRFVNYNEPLAMKQYLEAKGIASGLLIPDYAGRSTYESCERARKVFNIQETIIFSAGSHLPRAIYLCEHFGIRSRGVSSNLEANNATRRELLARVKALYNVYIRPETTVLGDQIIIP